MPNPGQTRKGAQSNTGTMLREDDSVLDVAATLESAVTNLAQVVKNTGGTDAVNIETILQAVESSQEELVALVGQLVTGDGTTYLPLMVAMQAVLVASRDYLQAIGVSTALLDNAIGTHGDDVSTAIIATGSKAVATVPAAVADGEDVRDNRDVYGRARSAEYDPSTGSAQVSVVAQTKIPPLIEDGWDALTAAGDLTPQRDVRDYRNHTVTYDITIGALDSMDLIIWGSLDGSLWFKMWEDNILNSEDLEDAITFSNVQVTYIRCELQAENGDTDGSVVFQLTSGD